MSKSDTAIIFKLAWDRKALAFDYTPNWGRGVPSTYINNVTFPKVLIDKAYKYRVVANGRGLGVRPSKAVHCDGSQQVDFLEYHLGLGIEDTETIQVYIVDPETGDDHLIAQWN